MADKIGIMGAGALGSYVGAFLSRIGESVTFLDMWPEHVEKTVSYTHLTLPTKA